MHQAPNRARSHNQFPTAVQQGSENLRKKDQERSPGTNILGPLGDPGRDLAEDAWHDLPHAGRVFSRWGGGTGAHWRGDEIRHDGVARGARGRAGVADRDATTLIGPRIVLDATVFAHVDEFVEG